MSNEINTRILGYEDSRILGYWRRGIAAGMWGDSGGGKVTEKRKKARD